MMPNLREISKTQPENCKSALLAFLEDPAKTRGLYDSKGYLQKLVIPFCLSTALRIK